MDHPHLVMQSLEAAFNCTDVPLSIREESSASLQRSVSACLGCVYIPADASRWGAQEIRSAARQLRDLFPELAQPTQIILLLITDNPSCHHRTESKLVDMMQRLEAEAAAILGVTVSINAIDVPAAVDCVALRDKLINYFGRTETLVSGEVVHFPELAHHSISAVLSDRFT